MKENSLLTKNQSPGDSRKNQLISVVHDIHSASNDLFILTCLKPLTKFGTRDSYTLNPNTSQYEYDDSTEQLLLVYFLYQASYRAVPLSNSTLRPFFLIKKFSSLFAVRRLSVQPQSYHTPSHLLP